GVFSSIRGYAMKKPGHSTKRGKELLGGVCVVLAMLAFSGCATAPSKMTTGSIPKLSKPVETMNATELRVASEQIGKAYEKNPKDRNTGLAYANVLHMTGHDTQALAVMQQVAIAHPSDRDVL